MISLDSTTNQHKNQEKPSEFDRAIKENGKLEDSRAIQRIKKAVGLLSSKNEAVNSSCPKQDVNLDSTDATTISNYNTKENLNQANNLEKARFPNNL